MDKVEASGRTLEEAVQVAAQQLGVGVDAVEYEVVEEGTKGFLGLGQSPTVVQAWVREGYDASARSAPAYEAPVEDEEAEQAAEEEGEPEAEYEEEPEEELEEEEPEEEEPEEEAEEEPEEAPEEPVARVDAAAPEAAAGEPTLVESLTQFLNEVLTAMGVDAKPVLKSADSDEVTVEIVGKDVAILIGKRGQTLDALQYLAGIVANRDSRDRRRVILDAEGYRERYKETLERKALEYARAVKEEGKEAVLEPQSARDRRIVHLALADHPDVYTYSEGEGEDRHVVISPKK